MAPAPPPASNHPFIVAPGSRSECDAGRRPESGGHGRNLDCASPTPLHPGYTGFGSYSVYCLPPSSHDCPAIDAGDQVPGRIRRGTAGPNTANGMVLNPYKGVIRRFLVLLRHLLGLLAGGVVAQTRALPPEQKQGLHHLGRRVATAVFQPLLNREIVNLPFSGQLRRRLELAGPTYVKLGQIMAVREDMLPKSITGAIHPRALTSAMISS